MKREPVESSSLASIGYDNATETLEIEFRRGGIYQYYNVPSRIFDELMVAGSKGQFFHAYIKSTYSYAKM